MNKTKIIIGNNYAKQIQNARKIINELVILEEKEKFKNEKQNRND